MAEYTPVPVKRGSIINQAAEEICRLIDGTALRPGDAIPPETTLSAMLGLSRNSIREAIRMLHGLGVIEKKTGRSAVVTSASTAGWGIVDEAALLEAAEVANDVRVLTMQKCASLAAMRMSDEDLRRLAQEYDALTAAVQADDRAAAKRAHDAFYGLILAGAGNPLLVAMFKQADTARLTTLSVPASKTFVSRQHLDHHRALLTALSKRDSAGAASAARRHYASLGRMIRLVTARPARSSGSRPLAKAGGKKIR